MKKSGKAFIFFIIILFMILGILTFYFIHNEKEILKEEQNIVQNTELANNKVENTTLVEEKKEEEILQAEETKNIEEAKKEELENTEKKIEEKSDNNTNNSKKTIVIDPGHQRKGDNSKEPIGPGASEQKAKVTTGVTGVSTGQTEAELNLKVGLLLQKELEKRGYNVIMVRTTNDVNISNSERAEIANNANADAFVRIHADSVDSSSVTGMSTLCQTSKNPYNANLAETSYDLSKKVLDNMVKATGAKSRGVTKTDNMSGINWAKVPTTIIEMGFLSNPEEDKKLNTEEYQKKIVNGIANGIEEYLK